MKSRALTISFVCFCASASALAQVVAGRLSGSVVDTSGAGVPNASVSLYLPVGAAPLFRTVTSGTGEFDFTALRPDTYRLVIESPGFSAYTQNNVTVDTSRQTSLPAIKLQLSSASQAIEVNGAVETVAANSAEITATVTKAQLNNLPAPDRQVTSLFRTQLGVTYSNVGNTTVNGLRPSYTNVTIDGIAIQDVVRTNDLDFLPARLTIGQVAEFTISTSGSNPAIGGAAGTISLITASGTNGYHGSLYWYNRNSYFAANNFFSNKAGVALPFLNLNQLGGAIGGPIRKDKLFFFANYEAYRSVASTLQTATILTPAARQGILTYPDANGHNQQFNVLQAMGLQASPFIQNMLSSIPTAGNRSDIGDGLNTTGYSFNQENNEIRDNVTGKVDYNLSEKNVFQGSFFWSRDVVDRPGQGGIVYGPTSPITNNYAPKVVAAAWRWTPKAALTNEVRGGFSISPLPFLRSGTTPSVFVSGTLFTPNQSTFLPEGRNVNTYTLQDNASWIHGRHSVAFGFQTMQQRLKFYGSNGTYETVPAYAIGLSASSPYGFTVGSIPGANQTYVTRANSLLTTLAGIVTSGTQFFNATSPTSGYIAGPYEMGMHFNEYAAYAQDTWKVSRTLTVVAGLRFDHFSPVSVNDGLVIQPQLINGSISQTLLGNATLNFGPNPMYQSDWHNFAPNVGAAWDPFGTGKTSFRAGYGIAMLNDNMANNAYNAITGNVGLSNNFGIGNLNAFIDHPPPIPTPPFQIPVTNAQLFNPANPANRPTEYLLAPNLATPYVQQWHLDLQQEWKGWIFEARYIGNHASKELVPRSLNQVNLNAGGFMPDFLRAQQNGILSQQASGRFNPAYDPAVPGSQPLPFISSLPGGGMLTNATVSNDILTGQAAALANLYQNNLSFPSAGFSYVPNPYVSGAYDWSNFGNSTFNAGQFEIRKQTRNGIQIQANYQFAKSLTNTVLYRSTETPIDINNPRLVKNPAGDDIRHSFKINHYLPLPAGDGHRLNSRNGVLNRLLGGWGLSGFFTLQSGEPVGFYSLLSTFSIVGTNPANTQLSHSQVSALTGLFQANNTLYFFNPKNIGPSGVGASPPGTAPFPNQVLFNPGAGQIGQLQPRSIEGPWFVVYNFAVLKDTKITERHSIRLRADFYNLTNHTNFGFVDTSDGNGNANINSTNFGKITSQFSSGDGVSSRRIQFGLYYRF